jgi:DNA-directed RNA polymerase specialized sigma subunit
LVPSHAEVAELYDYAVRAAFKLAGPTCRLHPDVIQSAAGLALTLAINSYKPERGKLKTWAWLWVRREVFRELRKR